MKKIKIKMTLNSLRPEYLSHGLYFSILGLLTAFSSNDYSGWLILTNILSSVLLMYLLLFMAQSLAVNSGSVHLLLEKYVEDEKRLNQKEE